MTIALVARGSVHRVEQGAIAVLRGDDESGGRERRIDCNMIGEPGLGDVPGRRDDVRIVAGVAQHLEQR